MAASAERMSRVDHAWLRMDSDLNLMMIVGVWLLRPRLSYRALCRRIEQRLLQYPRFRQKVVEDALGAQWVDDADFDIGHHVVRERLARRRAGSEREALQARCGELAMTRLDPARPLWQFHLIEQHDGGSALIVRIHHCIGDGIALTAVLMSITDGGELPPRSAPTDAGSGAVVGGDAGEMAAAGFRLGDRVCALLAGGGYAELCVAPIGQCLPVPQGLSDI